MFRPRHLACLLVLLSAIGAAGAPACATQALSPAGRYIHALLYRGSTSTQTESAQLGCSLTEGANSRDLALTPAAHVALGIAWAMRAPAAQTASVHAATSLRRA